MWGLLGLLILFAVTVLIIQDTVNRPQLKEILTVLNVVLLLMSPFFIELWVRYIKAKQ